MPNDSGEWPTRALVGPRTSGDTATSAILGALPSNEWTVFDGVRFPGRRTPLQIAVGPQGVFVVESRQRPWMSGRDELRPGGVRQDVVVAAGRGANAVRALTGLLDAQDVTPVVCFLGRELAPVVAGDVVICSSRNLLAILTTGPTVLDDAQRQLVALDLDTSIGASSRTGSRSTLPRRRWLRAQLFGIVLACVGSVGLWQVADAAAGPDRPIDSTSAVAR
ncbi:nuclease-related domain-containing protein [Nocardioides sp. CER19]|uniref:nuclease-related domain-containing protein n=1 Tax=Nocardioides sp. CER19 TaxID=3038538 RepID=UPI002449C98A|nr:nuclease-related domain-containing protein [Nocardioides sp. CER19]MDH2414744.1 nuclease-related domain-containing protein [Nocardioides sp. CER19]